jgi:hypothetical protein
MKSFTMKVNIIKLQINQRELVFLLNVTAFKINNKLIILKET